MAHTQVLIVFAQVQHDAALADTLMPKLAEPVRARLQAMRSLAARNRSLTGYWLLARGAALAGLSDVDLSLLSSDVNGRPFIAGVPDFNISHSGQLVACAISKHGRVGMDVERIRTIDTARLQRFMRTDRAQEKPDDNAFFADWAAREASVKAGGRIGLARIAAVQLTRNAAHLDNETWQLHFPPLISGYAACLATEGAEIKLQIQDLSAALMKYSAA